MLKNNIEIITLNKPDITDFASARNELLKKTKSEWVIFLDSDEKLSSPITNISDKYNGYILERRNYFLGRYVGKDNIVRLGKKNAGMWKRAVHEKWEINGKIGILDNYIIHNTANNLRDYVNKINFYANLHATENLREGKKSNLFKIIFFPIGKFIVTYMKSKSIVFSIFQSFHSFLSWSQLWILQKD